MEKVYLAGGFHSDWQEKVKSLCSKRATLDEKGNIKPVWCEVDKRGMSVFNWLDPKEKERGNFAVKENWTASEYTQLDLHLIKQSDIVFAYLEKDNPGLGMIAECGYAVGLSKTVILVKEKPHEIHKDRYLDFLKEMCSISFDNLEDGIIYLKSFM